MVRVLHLIYGLNAGGAETLMYNITKSIDRSAYEFSFMIIKKDSNPQFYEEKLKNLGCNIISVSKKSFLQTRKNMIQEMNKGNFDIIHIHNGQCDKLIDVLLAKLSNGHKVVVHSHNSALQPNVKLYPLRVKLQAVFKNLYPFVADGYISCSRKATEWSFPKRIHNKVKWLKNGINVETFAFNPNAREILRNKYGMQDAFIIGHVGKYDLQKNHEYIIDVFQSISMQCDNARLLLIGDGALKKKIVKQVEMLELKKKVLFISNTNIVNEYMSMMDVFIFPSLFEGLPVVGVEAQAASLITIASDTITSEVAVSQYWKCLELGRKEEWVQTILSYQKGYDRHLGAIQVDNNGFDITDVAEDLCLYYKNLL